MASETNWYDQLIKKAEFSYFGILSMVILIGSCWGAIAAMMIFQNNGPIWEVGIAIAATMSANTAAIGQAPTKWLINLAIASMAVNTLLILVNAF